MNGVFVLAEGTALIETLRRIDQGNLQLAIIERHGKSVPWPTAMWGAPCWAELASMPQLSRSWPARPSSQPWNIECGGADADASSFD